MRTPLPPTLPHHLPAYLPGRISIVPADRWPLGEPSGPVGVRIEVPRYGLDLRTLDVPIDGDRVRWLTEHATTRPLDARHVHLCVAHGRLHVVDGHHALAAHLVTGRERVPARLVHAPVAAVPTLG